MLFDLAQGQGKQLQTWNGPVREMCILYVSSRHVCKIKTAILDTLDKPQLVKNLNMSTILPLQEKTRINILNEKSKKYKYSEQPIKS